MAVLFTLGIYRIGNHALAGSSTSANGKAEVGGLSPVWIMEGAHVGSQRWRWRCMEWGRLGKLDISIRKHSNKEYRFQGEGAK